MSFRIQILLAMTTTISCSFLQKASNQFQSPFNATFLSKNERLFKPIIIPNATKFYPNDVSETRVQEITKTNTLHPEERSQETSFTENYSDKKPKTNLSSIRFSSRYSTEQDVHKKKDEKPGRNITLERKTDIPTESESSVKQSKTEEEKHDLFSVRSDSINDEDEDSDEDEKNTDETKKAEVAPTTEQPPPTSFQKYIDEDFENHETTSSSEENDSSEEKEDDESEVKRSIVDYHNSGSKNYHSVQTPLNQIHYRPHHEKNRARLVSPIDRHPATPNWPYSRPSIREFEDLNEIPDSDENYEKGLDLEIKKEVKAKPQSSGLELAVEKDELKFDRNEKYNYIEERNRQKQRQKGLITEEEKDDKRPFFRNVKQYQVNEKTPSKTHNKAFWSTTPKNIFKADTSLPSVYKNLHKFPGSTSRKPNVLNSSKDLSGDFQNHQFLGPVVFKENSEENNRPIKTNKVYIKGVTKNKKPDQDNLTNEKIQQSIFATGNKDIKSFNHLEESNEMYNAILANIQSVLALRTHPLKDSNSQKAEVNLDESKSLTWSLPLKKLD